mgnify:CR=1 FL=1
MVVTSQKSVDILGFVMAVLLKCIFPHFFSVFLFFIACLPFVMWLVDYYIIIRPKLRECLTMQSCPMTITMRRVWPPRWRQPIRQQNRLSHEGAFIYGPSETIDLMHASCHQALNVYTLFSDWTITFHDTLLNMLGQFFIKNLHSHRWTATA